MGVRADDQGLVFSVDFAPGAEGAFLGDATRLKQIVTNLTSNAVKFTPSGFVAVFVRVDGAESPGQDGDLHVEVRDSGVGFDMDQSPFLFERFAQADNSMSRRYGGAGLGLSICKGLAELMGGDISARSHPGQGSVFRLRVPVRRLNVVAEAPPAAGDGLAAAERRLRILLAEDHPMNQKVVGLLLEPFGVDLVVAHDGAEAIRLFEDESFDLILMDMQMPVTDGLAATLAIRRIEAAEGRAPIPIAMMTANTSDDHRAQAAAAGADGFISKPVTSESLLTGIDNLLALAPARCGAAAS
jgi:CheY-like chemotaxis protein